MDERLRRLERDRDQGGAEGQARWLRERLRAGALAPEALALLAWLGAPGAAQLHGGPPPPEAEEDWLEGLLPFGPEACLRAGLELLRLGLPAGEAARPVCPRCGSYGQVQERFAETWIWQACPSCAACPECGGTRRRGDDPCPACVDAAPRQAMDAVAAWLACPCARHARALGQLERTLQERLTETAGFAPADRGGGAAQVVAAAALALLQACEEHLPEERARGALRAAALAAHAAPSSPRAAVSVALLAWLLPTPT